MKCCRKTSVSVSTSELTSVTRVRLTPVELAKLNERYPFPSFSFPSFPSLPSIHSSLSFSRSFFLSAHLHSLYCHAPPIHSRKHFPPVSSPASFPIFTHFYTTPHSLPSIYYSSFLPLFLLSHLSFLANLRLLFPLIFFPFPSPSCSPRYNFVSSPFT